jgi:hypothetical protein
MRNFFITVALVAALLIARSLGARANEPSEPSVIDWLATSLLKQYPQANTNDVMLDVNARTISFALPNASMVCHIDMYWDGRVHFSDCHGKL